jgi:hypothetical protein
MPTPPILPLSDLSARLFWAKVRKTDGCWEWQGARKSDGYGQVPRSGRLRAAHRLSWELTHGPLGADECVLHHCDNPPCVRPDHLFIGDRRMNNADKLAKGRAGKSDQRGVHNPAARLTDDDVREVRRLGAVGLTHEDIAARKGVSRSLVTMILHGRRWSHVTP